MSIRSRYCDVVVGTLIALAIVALGVWSLKDSRACAAQPIVSKMTCTEPCYVSNTSLTKCYAACNTACGSTEALECQACCDRADPLTDPEIGVIGRTDTASVTRHIMTGARFTGDTMTARDCETLVWYGLTPVAPLRNFVLLLVGERAQNHCEFQGDKAKGEFQNYIAWGLAHHDATTRSAAIYAAAGAGWADAEAINPLLKAITTDPNESQANKTSAKAALTGWCPNL